jgi:hypothetical protein
MGPTPHIMEKKNSKVAIFREQFPKRRNPNVFYLPLWPLAKFCLVLLGMMANPPTSQIWKKTLTLEAWISSSLSLQRNRRAWTWSEHDLNISYRAAGASSHLMWSAGLIEGNSMLRSAYREDWPCPPEKDFLFANAAVASGMVKLGPGRKTSGSGESGPRGSPSKRPVSTGKGGRPSCAWKHLQWIRKLSCGCSPTSWSSCEWVGCS